MAEKNLSLPFLTAFNPKGVLEAQRQLASLSNSVKGFARNVISAFGGVSATAGSVMFLRNAITQSRDLARNTAALKTIFGSTSREMMKFSQNGVTMGLSTSQAAKAATFLGSVLKQAGFSMQDTATNTKQLVRLASDLATTYGYDVSEALTGMTALFRGEYDPIEKFGVAMKQAEVNALMTERGFNKLTGQEKLHAQQLIRLELLMQRTSDAQGAFGRQGDSLFVQQSKLSALWENMQATVGNKLTPALARFLEKLQPIVEKFAPRLEGIFDTFGSLIEDLTPQLDSFANGVGKSFENIAEGLKAIKPLLEGLLGLTFNNLDKILVFFAAFKIGAFAIRIARGAITAYKDAVKLATAAQVELTVAETAAGWRAMAGAIGLAVAAFALYVYEANKLNGLKGTSFDFFASNTPTGSISTGGANMFNPAIDGVKKSGEKLSDETKRAMAKAGKTLGDETSRFLARKDGYLKGGAVIGGAGTGAGGAGGAGGSTADKVKTFFEDLTEEIRKQALRIKLSDLGASQALIDAVLGSSTWEAAANKIIAGGTKTVDFVQRQFNKTKAGLEEIAKAAEEAAKKLEEYNQKLEKATDFSTDLQDALKGLTTSSVAESLGAFEQSIVSTFESITSKVQDAVKNDLIHPEDAQALLSYASASEVAMRSIAKQRDVLADRIQVVRDLISATKSAVMGFVNITSLLETQTKTITQSVVSVTDGIRLTLTNSLSVSEVSGSITDKFKEILAKTKQFATNLRELKRLGLDQNLFKQIVDGGLEAGGTTAAAIVAGGAGTVSELNSLFADLEMTGTEIAEQTAQVMYGAGVDITNGLVNGLLAQQDALTAAAKTLADGFATAFNSQMAQALTANMVAKPFNFMPDYRTEDFLKPTVLSPEEIAAMSRTTSRASVGAPAVFNNYINAGMGADGATIGQEIVSAIKHYERTNGAVWVTA